MAPGVQTVLSILKVENRIKRLPGPERRQSEARRRQMFVPDSSRCVAKEWRKACGNRHIPFCGEPSQEWCHGATAQITRMFPCTNPLLVKF